MERAAYDSIQYALEQNCGSNAFGQRKKRMENRDILDWNAAVLALARMYYLFYTGLGPLSEGGNDHLGMHNSFVALLAEELIPESYTVKDFSM